MSDSVDKYSFESIFDFKDCKIISNTGNVFDITNKIVGCVIFESLFSMFLTGRLSIIDDRDLIKNLPLSGNERIDLNIGITEDTQFQSSFRITKINCDEKEHGKDRTLYNVLTFYFTSEEAIISSTKKLCKAYNATPEAVITDVLQNTCNSIKTINNKGYTSTNIDFISNFWTPNKILQYVLTENDALYDLILYETFGERGRQEFHIERLNTLLSAQSVQRIIYDPTIEKLASNQINVFKHDRTLFDILYDANIGGLGSSTYCWASLSNIWELKQSKYEDIYNDHIYALGKYSNRNAALDKYYNLVEVNDGLDISYEYRRRILESFRNHAITVHMAGSKTRKIGKLVEFDYPNFDASTEPHRLYSGKWLISEIAHAFPASRRYSQTLRLVKNAFNNATDYTQITSKVNR